MSKTSKQKLTVLINSNILMVSAWWNAKFYFYFNFECKMLKIGLKFTITIIKICSILSNEIHKNNRKILLKQLLLKCNDDKHKWIKHYSCIIALLFCWYYSAAKRWKIDKNHHKFPSFKNNFFYFELMCATHLRKLICQSRFLYNTIQRE